MAWLRKNFLAYSLILLILFATSVSFVRFVILQDYMVAYEGACDPYKHSCFVGCENDTCTAEYYYSRAQKYAPDILAQCGPDVGGCDEASQCLPQEDDRCLITYCDPQMDGNVCDTLTEADLIPEQDNVPFWSGEEAVIDAASLGEEIVSENFDHDM